MADHGGDFALIAASLVALAAGPLLHRFLSRYRSTVALLDGFVLSSVGGLLGLHVLPNAAASLGVGLTALIAVIGLAGPWLLERALGHTSRSVHGSFLLIALLGLVIHSLFDGVVLAGAGGHDHAAEALGLAVVLHRLPVGLVAWWLVRPRYGTKTALSILAVIAFGTVLGWLLGGRLMGGVPETAGAVVQAFVGGSLVHVLLHPTEHAVEPHPITESLGFLAGVALLMFGAETGDDHAIGLLDHARRATVLLLGIAPALLVGYALAGLVAAFGPAVRDLRRGQPIARGLLYGLTAPIRSCTVVPACRRLADEGAPPAAIFAVLLAALELSVEASVLSVPLLGVELTIARVLAVLALTVAVALVLGATQRRAPATPPDHHHEASPPLGQRLQAGLRFAFGEVVEHSAAWMILGVALATGFQTPPALLATWTPGVELLVFALAGVPFYICAAGATPFAAALLAWGVSPGAALAFLVAGPATNLTTAGALSRTYGAGVAVGFVALVAVGAAGAGAFVGALIEVEAPWVPGEPTAITWIAAAVVGLAYARAFARLGPRAFLASLGSGEAHLGGPHGHHHH